MVKKFIVVNSIFEGPNRTFTVCHELGHFFLHKPVSGSHWFFHSTNAKFISAKQDAEADAVGLIMMIPYDMMLELYHTPFSEIDPEILPYLKRRYELWQKYGF